MAICDCDRHIFPLPPDIPASLQRLPRQIGTFADYRRSLLGRIRDHAPLDGWRARDEEDIGLMLLEWWAYVADVVSFYNAEHVHDLYIGTARGDEALRRIVELIGYRPRPALAAEAVLAALADGADPVEAPAGAGFISDAIDDTPPQEFELSAATWIDPLRNGWPLAPIRTGEYDPAALLIEPRSANLAEEALFVLDAGGERAALRVAALEAETALDGQSYLRLSVSDPARVPIKTLPLSAVRLWAFTQTAPVLVRNGNRMTLIGMLPQLRAGELVVIEDMALDAPLPPEVRTVSKSKLGTAVLSDLMSTGLDAVVGGVVAVEAAATVAAGKIESIFAEGIAGNPVQAAGVAGASAVGGLKSGGGTADLDPGDVTTPITVLTLNGGSAIPASRARLHFGRIRGGRLTAPAKPEIGGGDILKGPALAGRHQSPALDGTGELLLKGVQDRGKSVAATVRIDADTGAGFVDPGGSFTVFEDRLRIPVTVHGNLLHVTRGKSVEEELGSGEGPQSPFQTFQLSKAPLTYVRDASAKGGRRSTLRLWIDGIEWTEVENLFTADDTDRVFTVYLDADGKATVTTGGEGFGMPAPLGTSNVFAQYRFGAGDPPPGANAIQQIAGPVPKLRRVFNPTPAYGGGAGDRPEDIRFVAPASAATFDRAVSAADFAALARDFGALSAVAVTQWVPARLRAGVVATAIFEGEATDEAIAALEAHLVARAAESLPITVIAAVPVAGVLRLRYGVAADADPQTVRAALDELFNDPFTGILSPRRAAIGGPVFRSALLAAAAKVLGLETVLSLALDDTAAPARITIPANGYFAPDVVFEGGAS